MLSKRLRSLRDKRILLRKLQAKPVKFRRNFLSGRYRNIAKIYMKTSYSNIFVSLTDMDDKLIVCCTSGSSGVRKNKRMKCAPQAVGAILDKLSVYFFRYRIRFVEVIIADNIGASTYALLYELRRHGVVVVCLKDRRVLAHNGPRPRKLRRT